VRISIDLPPEFLDRRNPLLRRPAQPVLQVLPDLGIAVHVVNLYDLANHVLILSSWERIR